MTEAPAVLHATHSLRAAQRLFDEKRFRHLPVIKGRQLVGVLSNRDIATFLAKWPGGLDMAIGLAMTQDPTTVTPETSAADAARLLVVQRVHSLLVVNSAGALLGIVTDTDLLRLLIRFLDRCVPSAREESAHEESGVAQGPPADRR